VLGITLGVGAVFARSAAVGAGVVRDIPPSAFKLERGRRKQPFDRPTTFFVSFERRIREFLYFLKLLTAGIALVLVDCHYNPRT